jgi:hypothetical protein
MCPGATIYVSAFSYILGKDAGGQKQQWERGRVARGGGSRSGGGRGQGETSASGVLGLGLGLGLGLVKAVTSFSSVRHSESVWVSRAQHR